MPSEIESYVAQHLGRGADASMVRTALLQVGWPEVEIDRVISAYQQSSAVAVKTAQPRTSNKKKGVLLGILTGVLVLAGVGGHFYWNGAIPSFIADLNPNKTVVANEKTYTFTAPSGWKVVENSFLGGFALAPSKDEITQAVTNEPFTGIIMTGLAIGSSTVESMNTEGLSYFDKVLLPGPMKGLGEVRGTVSIDKKETATGTYRCKLVYDNQTSCIWKSNANSEVVALVEFVTEEVTTTEQNQEFTAVLDTLNVK